jgi:hypothetical protein
LTPLPEAEPPEVLVLPLSAVTVLVLPLSALTVLVLPEATVLPEAMFLPPLFAVAALVPPVAVGLVVLVLLIEVECELLSLLLFELLTDTDVALPESLLTARLPLFAEGLPAPLVLLLVSFVLVLELLLLLLVVLPDSSELSLA